MVDLFSPLYLPLVNQLHVYFYYFHLALLKFSLLLNLIQNEYERI